MRTRTLPRDTWEAYFCLVSKFLLGKGVDIELLSEGLGAQRGGMAWQMLGITYDPRDDVLEVAGEKFGHFIDHPRLIRVEEDGLVLKILEVTQENGTRQILTVLEPLALPIDERSAR